MIDLTIIECSTSISPFEIARKNNLDRLLRDNKLMKTLFKVEDEILNEFEAGSPFGQMERIEEYYLMYLSRYGIDPRTNKNDK